MISFEKSDVESNDWKLSKMCIFQISYGIFQFELSGLGWKMVKWQSSSNWKSKTIFPTSSLSWFQKCQNFWKKFIFWKKLPQKNSTGSLAVRFFLLKKLYLMNVWLSTSLGKILRFVSKIENLTSQNWVSCCDLSLMSRQDLFRILTELYLVNIQFLAKVFRPTPIKRYKASKNGFLVLFFTIFELQDSILSLKVWNCEELVWLWNKWLWNPYVAGFNGPHEHNNSI